MIRKYVYGTPFPTEAVVEPVPEANEQSDFVVTAEENGLRFTRNLSETEIVYGLGETMRGINKRGGRYVSFNTDDMYHREDMPSLYGSHNFVVLDGEKKIGAFFDTPACVVFEVDYQGSKKIDVLCEGGNLNLYLIEGSSAYDVVKQFLKIIGRSFLPPLWAFGFGQSRWGYKNEKDVDRVIKGYEKAKIPLDFVCLDIDYMDRYIDFTVNKKRFPDLPAYVKKLRQKGVRLVPIIDAAIKVEPGNSAYEEGVANEYFCTNESDKPFLGAVWPGMTHFPDFLRPEVREWFGKKYSVLTDCGIEGFWSDMNEPSLFYSEYTAKEKDYPKNEKYREQDYKRFFHTLNGKKVRHYDVHNLYGYNMMRAAGEQLHTSLDKRYLQFSRSSYIGSHRYGGIWTGDNHSCWAHLKQNFLQMPSLNMCGILYAGADTGGFSGWTTRELLLRWLAVSAFTPLMRNHCMKGMRPQECYQFFGKQDFRRIVSFRYRILPYLYSEFMKAALANDMLFKPLAFEFPDDEKVKEIEDQLLVGECLMIAPILEKGKRKRSVYLPEDMTMVRYGKDSFICERAEKGEREISVPLNEIVFFIRKGKAIPVEKPCRNTDETDLSDVTLLGDGASYRQYLDDGFTKNCSPDNIRTVTK